MGINVFVVSGIIALILGVNLYGTPIPEKVSCSCDPIIKAILVLQSKSLTMLNIVVRLFVCIYDNCNCQLSSKDHAIRIVLVTLY